MADNYQESQQHVYIEQSQQLGGQQISENQELQNSSYTRTDIKVAVPDIMPPFVSTSVNAQDLVGEGFQASASRVSGAAQEHEVVETAEQAEEARKEREAKAREQELLNAFFEKELERRTEVYRKQQEVESEKIRKELEKQHQKDVEFRKELIELAIENQKKQIDLEARYAKKNLERERAKARMALEKSQFHSDIQVNMNAAVGKTESGSQLTVVSESESARNIQ